MALQQVITILVLNLHFSGNHDNDHKVPDWVRRYVMHSLATVLGMSKLMVSDREHQAKLNAKDTLSVEALVPPIESEHDSAGQELERTTSQVPSLFVRTENMHFYPDANDAAAYGGGKRKKKKPKPVTTKKRRRSSSPKAAAKGASRKDRKVSDVHDSRNTINEAPSGQGLNTKPDTGDKTANKGASNNVNTVNNSANNSASNNVNNSASNNVNNSAGDDDVAATGAASDDNTAKSVEVAAKSRPSDGSTTGNTLSVPGSKEEEPAAQPLPPPLPSQPQPLARAGSLGDFKEFSAKIKRMSHSTAHANHNQSKVATRMRTFMDHSGSGGGAGGELVEVDEDASTLINVADLTEKHEVLLYKLLRLYELRTYLSLDREYKNEVQCEWQQLAMLIDRFMFFVFVTMTVLLWAVYFGHFPTYDTPVLI